MWMRVVTCSLFLCGVCLEALRADNTSNAVAPADVDCGMGINSLFGLQTHEDVDAHARADARADARAEDGRYEASAGNRIVDYFETWETPAGTVLLNLLKPGAR